MFSAWIRIDETLPWIELKGSYETRSEANRAAKEAINAIRIKTASITEKNSSIRALATVRT
ncbi:MAG TPA: hypothetical protein VMT01_01660 [Candidatus Acidoferrum sp.]|nr:hypothetical protein [Candidatus Acidoferrum sp.]